MVYSVMKFAQWLLSEIQHISFSKVMSINGIRCDAIDFRFEDWGKGLNPNNNHDSLVPIQSGERFFRTSFSAPIQHGWLNVNLNNSQPQNQGSLGLAVMAKPKATIDAQAEFAPLPQSWFNFAILYSGNHVVKAPEWPRYKSEMNVAEPLEIR